ncbi:hypothetical protein DXG01_004657 [Tephrocybe rancida]|nr:hypothetical protein DXG01_004657 [Tephrocybe rancida]
MAIHDVVYRALGLSRYGSDAHSRVQYNVILDAEMVPFDGEKIAEFHTIKALIEDTAIGIRKRKHIQVESQADSEACSQSSMQTDHSGKLGLVFFDILSLESKSLLMTPYHKRREILEGLIQVLPGECILGERFPIGVRGVSYSVESQIVALDRVFAESIATHEEGLVLKGDDSKYHDFYTPWVKLKRDYIPGHGDTVDMVIVGVTWERERARVLRVPPSTITTFYIGGVKNSEEIRRQPSIRPHLEVYFTVSYGLSRSQLKEINFHIRNSETIPYKPTMKLESDALEYTFSLYPGLAPPKFILKEPLLAELYGAGFTKSPKCDHYELRFPRVTKIHRPADRPWTDGKNLIELHKLACEVVGRDSAAKEAKNATAEMWGITASPGAKSTQKMNATRRVWLGKLAALDGRDRMSDRESRSPSPPSSPMPAAKRPRTGRVKKNDEVKAISRLRTPQAGSSNIQTIASTHNDLVDSLVPSNSPRSQGSVDALESQSSQFGKSSAQPLGTMTNICPAPSSGPRSQRSTFGLPCSPSSTPPRPPRPRLKALLPETIPPVNAFTTTALALPFPENALVWFAKPRGESWAVKSTVPRGQRTHSVEALLAGCGWYADTRGTPWAEKGIVLVDDESVAGKEMARQVLKTMDERSKELPGDQARKTIWIFDRTTWALVEEVESNALHKFE